MANFVTTETAVIQQAGYAPAIVKIYGTYASSAGATGGAIAPGYSLTGGTYTIASSTNTSAPNAASVGGRKILGVTVTPGTQDATTPAAVVSYNATLDRYVVTITSVADATGTYILECQDNGA